MATRWSSQEVMRGAIVVPVEDLHKSRQEFQTTPEMVELAHYAEAQAELALMTKHTAPRSRNHAVKRHRYKAMMRLLKAGVVAEVQRMTGVTIKEMAAPDNNKRLWRARRLVYWGLHELMGCSHDAIAKLMNRDYSTVCHGVQEAPIRHQNDVAELQRRCLP